MIEKLKVLFTGYSGFPPTCFIFCGNFLSTPLGSNHAKVLKGKLMVNVAAIVYTVKPVLSGHSKRTPKLVFNTDYG